MIGIGTTEKDARRLSRRTMLTGFAAAGVTICPSRVDPNLMSGSLPTSVRIASFSRFTESHTDGSQVPS